MAASEAGLASLSETGMASMIVSLMPSWRRRFKTRFAAVSMPTKPSAANNPIVASLLKPSLPLVLFVFVSVVDVLGAVEPRKLVGSDEGLDVGACTEIKFGDELGLWVGWVLGFCVGIAVGLAFSVGICGVGGNVGVFVGCAVGVMLGELLGI